MTLNDSFTKQNFGSVYVGTHGGFNGNVSNLWYYDYAISSMEIQKLLGNGPTTNLASSAAQSTILSKDYNYLATSWYNP